MDYPDKSPAWWVTATRGDHPDDTPPRPQTTPTDGYFFWHLSLHISMQKEPLTKNHPYFNRQEPTLRGWRDVNIQLPTN